MNRLFLAWLTLALAGCFPYRSTAFYPSARVGSGSFSQLQPGESQVLEVCRQWVAPVPDAATGYCFRLQVRPDLLRPGRELAIPGEGVEPHLWVIAGAPRIAQSRSAVGRLRVVRVGEREMVAELEVRDNSIGGEPWELHGTRRFRRREIPPPYTPYRPVERAGSPRKREDGPSRRGKAAPPPDSSEAAPTGQSPP
jgi:hypothetical protein